MSRDRMGRVRELFEKALELCAEERTAFLDEACGNDSALRREVDSLLAADEASDGFMERPVVQHGFDLSSAGAQRAGERRRIGHYDLLRRIGEGGMSEVYLAVRADDEYRKRVALKIVRHDLDREDMLRRFRTERQILAGLDHPNIAKLLDGGTTDEGLPYFVMDYIDGVPIDEYADRNRLTVRERLELFRTVCSAVQYAHQNLVIHRDIKASNILVTSDGVPKLLDFGIAKLLKPDQFAQSVEYTATWLRPMTPMYASPEQIQGKLVTTASDVYSLGVLLYMLLTGHRPYRMETRSPTEFARAVAEQEPDKPSSVIDRRDATEPRGPAEAAVTPESVSLARNVQPQQLRRQLAGDLDTIVLMALRKEPQRRYGSVEQFSEDVRRHVEGLPVLARKDTLSYRTAKFVKRNWLAAGAAVAFLVLLIGFAATMTIQATRIARERDQVRRERDRAEQVVEFLESIFEVADPTQAQGETITAREILDRGAERVNQELEGQPEVQATLIQAIGNVYKNLGLFDRTRPLLEEALQTRREIFGDDHAAVAETLHELGVLDRLQGDYDGAEAMIRQALEIRRRFPEEERDAVAASLNQLGIVLRFKGDFDASIEAYREAIAIKESTGHVDAYLAEAKNNLGAVLLELGEMPESEALIREALELRREVLNPRDPMLIQNLSNLGACLGMQGKYEDAEPLLREAVGSYREVLDEGHPHMVEALNNLAKLLHRLGNLEESEQLYLEALDIERKRVGEGHPNVAHIASNLADLFQDRGDWEAAEAQVRKALEIRRETFGDRHPSVGSSLVGLSAVLVETGRGEEAETLAREGLEISREALPPDHWRLDVGESVLGSALAVQGRLDEAESHLVAGYEGLRDKRGPDYRLTQTALLRLIELYEAAGDAEAAASHRELLTD
jgi:serine/threonine-protein kinase